MLRTMSPFSLVLLLGLGALGGWLSLPGASAQPRGAEGQRPSCVAVESEARMRAFGFDHVVQVRNGCEQALTCRVSSDVNPSPQSVRVERAGTAEVLLWRGSPASTFSPRVDCELAR